MIKFLVSNIICDYYHRKQYQRKGIEDIDMNLGQEFQLKVKHNKRFILRKASIAR